MSVSRRDFLKLMGMGAGVGATLAGENIMKALAAPDLPAPLRGPANDVQRDPVMHMLNRVTFGPRPGQMDAVKKMGIQQYLEQQLYPEKIDDQACEDRLGDFITLDMTVPEMLGIGKQQNEVAVELITATFMRAIYSERQLNEVMVNFWSEHFSIYHHKEQLEYLKTVDDREVIRKYALGKFRDLLGASAKSPAMLMYLDNALSRKEHPNENYARELMELHTITIGNYTEDDVKQVARAFTGWTIKRPDVTFTFNPKFHDDGVKTILGRTFPAGGGIKDGEMVLDMLAVHPGTANHIASKLCRRFIGDTFSDATRQVVADKFISSGGDIREVLRTIFASSEFLNAQPKFKRPFEYLVSIYRALNMEQSVDGVAARPKAKAGSAPKPLPGVPAVKFGAGELLKNMGHLPFDWPTPDGYSDVGAYWMGDMLTRWNTAISAAYGNLRGATTDLVALARARGVKQDPQSVVAYYANHLLGRTLSQGEQDAIWTFATKTSPIDLTSPKGVRNLAETVALIVASPSFQFR